MKISKDFASRLKSKEVTNEMLSEAIFSLSKRAKNYRDLAREVPKFDKYHTKERYDAQKEEYYQKKDTLLKFSTPIEIHKIRRTKKRKVYDWMDEYYERPNQTIYEFMDRRGEFHSYYFEEYDSFYEYYLYYSVHSHTFHKPLETKDISKYNLNIIELDNLETYGCDTEDLVSVQFCDKIIKGLESGEYKLVA